MQLQTAQKMFGTSEATVWILSYKMNGVITYFLSDQHTKEYNRWFGS